MYLYSIYIVCENVFPFGFYMYIPTSKATRRSVRFKVVRSIEKLKLAKHHTFRHCKRRVGRGLNKKSKA